MEAVPHLHALERTAVPDDQPRGPHTRAVDGHVHPLRPGADARHAPEGRRGLVREDRRLGVTGEQGGGVDERGMPLHRPQSAPVAPAHPDAAAHLHQGPRRTAAGVALRLDALAAQVSTDPEHGRVEAHGAGTRMGTTVPARHTA